MKPVKLEAFRLTFFNHFSTSLKCLHSLWVSMLSFGCHVVGMFPVPPHGKRVKPWKGQVGSLCLHSSVSIFVFTFAHRLGTTNSVLTGSS